MEVILHRGERFEHDEGIPKQRLGTFEFAKTKHRDDVALLLRPAQLATISASTKKRAKSNAGNSQKVL